VGETKKSVPEGSCDETVSRKPIADDVDAGNAVDAPAMLAPFTDDAFVNNSE